MDAYIGSKEILFLCLLSTYLGVCESQAERSVRILGGPSPREGRVEVYYEDLWSTVSRDGWTEEEAVAVCRQLGFDGPAETVDPEPPIIAIDVPTVSVVCREGASSLLECDVERTEALIFESSLSYLDGHPYWDHSEVAGVLCKNAVTTIRTTEQPPITAIVVLSIILVVVIIVSISIIAVMCCRLKKEGVHNNERNHGSRAQLEQVAMHYDTHINKAYAEVQENRPQPYVSINPVALEPENPYLEIGQGPKDKPTKV